MLEQVAQAKHAESIARDLSFSILSLLSGDGERTVLVIDAFLDEGSTHRDAPLLSVGACFGEHDQWVEFLNVWQETSFHSHVHDYDHLKSNLLKAIEKCKLKGFVCSVSPKEYAESTGVRWKSKVGNAYAACTIGCFLWACHLSHGLSDSISFEIEDGQPNSEHIFRTLYALKHDTAYVHNHRVASIGLASKENFRQLHTSDFIAHSFSTSSKWVDYLREVGIIDSILTGESLRKASADLEELMRRVRWERRKIKEKERNARRQR